jgi:ribosomal-protein-alanine N-acetyltransferase
VLHPDFQAKGIMNEALLAVIKFGFEIMKVNTIDAEVDPNNIPSIKLLYRNGFVLTREAPNTVIYSLKK